MSASEPRDSASFAELVDAPSLHGLRCAGAHTHVAQELATTVGRKAAIRRKRHEHQGEAMSRTKLVLLIVLVVGTSLAVADEPAYKRLLQGDDAKKAEPLQKRIDELWAAGKFAEAVAPAEELLAVRQRVQGTGHWEVADAARRVQTLRQAARLPAAQQQALAEVLPTEAKADEMRAQGKYA
jgi:hypothetical protein